MWRRITGTALMRTQSSRSESISHRKPVQKPEEKPPLENWQKYMENGEYLRSSEISEEQNYNMIDGRRNNMPPKKDQDIGIGKAAPKTGRDCKTKRKGSTADGSGGRYGAQTEIKVVTFL